MVMLVLQIIICIITSNLTRIVYFKTALFVSLYDYDKVASSVVNSQEIINHQWSMKQYNMNLSRTFQKIIEILK